MTPRQKKQLSYARDRRNGYGENSKSSRKNIPLRRARKHRLYRHATKQAITSNPGDEIASWDQIQSAVAVVRRDGWKKVGDIPLSEHVARRVAKRVRTGQQPV